MVSRRVQKTGTSTYIVSLPKEWVETNGIKEKEEIEIKEKGKKLVISKHFKKEVKVIDGSEKPTEQVIRELISAYIEGSENIVVENISDLKKIVVFVKESLIGMEVIKDIDIIEIKNIIDEERYPLMDIIYRVKDIVNWMIENSFKALKENNSELCESILEKDKEIDRLTLFSFRIINEILNDNVSPVLPMNVKEILSIYSVFELMEKVGDSAKNISESIIDVLKEGDIDNDSYKFLESLKDRTMKNFNMMLELLEGNDISRASYMIDKLKENEKKKSLSFREIPLNRKTEKVIPQITIIVENLYNINTMVKDIGESVIDGMS